MFLTHPSAVTRFRTLSLILVVFFSQSIPVLGQRQAKIKGVVNDTESQAVPFATVEVIDSKSNEVLTKTATDQHGLFSVLISKVDAVFVKVDALGYKNKTTDVLQVASGGMFTLKPIALEKEEIMLDEIKVMAKVPPFVRKGDRTVVNLERNVLAAGSNTLDALSRLPGVFVDKDGNITYNNKTNVLITINGRQTYMEPGDLATYLKGQPSESLKDVELFSNPPASFDAEGNGGVINLNLKDIKVEGLNGSLSAGTKYNGGWGYTSGTSLNYKLGRWQAKLGISRNSYFTDVDLKINKLFMPAVSQPTIMEQTIDWDVRLKTFLMDIGVDYSISQGHRVGFTYQHSSDDRKDFRNAFTRTFSAEEEDPEISTIVKDEIPGKRHSFDLFYVADLDTLGSGVSTGLSYIRSDRGFNSRLNSASLNGLEQQLFTDNPVEYQVLAGQLDLSNVYGGGKTFKAGVKYSHVSSDNNLNMQIHQGDTWEVDRGNSYRFLYYENIAAGYVNYHTPIGKKATINGGFRVEYTNGFGENLTTGFQTKRSYVNLFPSLSVEHKISGTYTVAYNFNRRIIRPNFKLLNPFVRYVDPFTVHTGFSQIKPSYTNNIEINNIFKDKYQFALTYARTTDVFGVAVTQNDSSLVSTYQTRNLDSQTDFGIRGTFSVSFITGWQSDNSAQLSRTSFKSVIGHALLDHSLTTYSLQSQHNLSLVSGVKFQVVGSLFGPRQYSLFTQDTQFNLDAGLQKTFL